jgi:hypothetical protein
MSAACVYITYMLITAYYVPENSGPAPNHSQVLQPLTPLRVRHLHTPRTSYLVTLLVVSFPFLAFRVIISLPSFPIRGVCLIGGLLPFFLTHPWTRMVGVFELVIQGLLMAWKRIE